MNFYFQQYIDILNEELLEAMGCTEPIAVAYAAAVAKEILGEEIHQIECFVSGNIIKNVKSVIVPHTGGLRGIEAAVAAGVVAGKAKDKLQVIASVCDEEIRQIRRFRDDMSIRIIPVEHSHIFEIGIRLYGRIHQSYVRIVDFHTNVTTVQRDGVDVDCEYRCREASYKALTNHDSLSIEKIWNFANRIELDRVSPILDQQIACNLAIAERGLTENYGSNIGSIALRQSQWDPENKAKAYAAAASDARMNGCQMPVVINSGSGNQGITASVPVIVYAREKGYPVQLLYRALLISNLCTIHIKSGVGRLSAYCGVVAAGAAAGAAIAYLEDRSLTAVSETLSNALAITSGMICDGAKSSCAGKIMIALTAGFLGFHMYETQNSLKPGDGIVKGSVEETIVSVGSLASKGMIETDKEIIRIMVSD